MNIHLKNFYLCFVAFLFFLVLLCHSFLLTYHHLHQLNVRNQYSVRRHNWLPLSLLNLSYIFIYVFGILTLFNVVSSTFEFLFNPYFSDFYHSISF